jgi:conjugative relaxase-like TrwC/TraI family protein
MAWMRMMGVDSVEYHRETVAERGDDHPGRALDYYGSRGETPLAWGGGGASRLGLSGPVSPEAYEAIFGPGGVVHPTERWKVVSTRRPGLELVVAAHKSVALLGLIGRAEDMDTILDAERDATLGYLDHWMSVQGGRRGRAQHRSATGGLTYATTRHATSRAGDPSAHDHVLIANVVAMLDDKGGWKALDTAAVRDVLHSATAVGRVVAARTAVGLGYAIEPDPGKSGRLGHWRIAGMHREACELFSKRADEIDTYLEERGFDSPKAAGIAARKTRAPKRGEGHDELLPRWRDELAEIGLTVTQLAASIDRAKTNYRTPPPLDDRQIAELAEQILGVEGELARRKVFTKRDVIVAVAPHIHGQDPRELGRVVNAVIAGRAVVPLLATAGAREPAFAPAHVLATEQAIVKAAQRLAGSEAVRLWDMDAGIGIDRKEKALGAPLSAGQRAAVRSICSPRRLTIIEGVAGAGKTTAIDAARDAHEYAGWRVLGCATSGQAARTLGTDANITSRTIASLLWNLDHGKLTLDDRTLVVLDEAGMTADADLARILTAVNQAGAKLVLVGDPKQLSAVGPGGALDAVIARHPDTHLQLHENLRQRDPDERAALEQLRSGDVSAAVAWYAANDRIHIQPKRVETLATAVAAWDKDVDAGHDTQLLAWKRKDVADLNRLARHHWARTGRIAGPELELPDDRRYAAGDLVVTTAPNHDAGLVNSQRAVITAIDEPSRHVLLHTDDDRHVWVDPAEGLDHAYATTIHRAQGVTLDTAHVIANGGGRELAYVALSRARHATTVYAVGDTPADAIHHIESDWTSGRAAAWIAQPVPEQEPAPPVLHRDRSVGGLGR